MSGSMRVEPERRRFGCASPNSMNSEKEHSMHWSRRTPILVTAAPLAEWSKDCIKAMVAAAALILPLKLEHGF